MLKISWSKVYNHPLPENHRFPMLKYDLIPEQLMYEGTIKQKNLFEPDKITSNIVEITHDESYVGRLKSLELSKSEQRKTGFPLSKELVEREFLITGGTLECAHFALAHGVSMNVAGGTHHAYRDRGEGFCLLNDQATVSNYLLRQKLARRILIVDLDVHQGNGTAQIFKNEPRVFTFSMHGGKNYPLKKESSDLDVPLEDNTGDEVYLTVLQEHLDRIMDTFRPDFVFYQSGVDVLESDKLGRLGLTREGCKQRDYEVLSRCKSKRLPLVICMGGGYSPRLVDIVEAHANTFRLAQEIFF